MRKEYEEQLQRLYGIINACAFLANQNADVKTDKSVRDHVSLFLRLESSDEELSKKLKEAFHDLEENPNALHSTGEEDVVIGRVVATVGDISSLAGRIVAEQKEGFFLPIKPQEIIPFSHSIEKVKDEKNESEIILDKFELLLKQMMLEDAELRKEIEEFNAILDSFSDWSKKFKNSLL